MNVSFDPALYDWQIGRVPLLISIPHAGTYLPEPIGKRLTISARRMPDTDWFLDALYAWAQELGAFLLCAKYSRYVVDLNRPPDDEPLYTTPTTGLFPTVQFDGSPVYVAGMEPTFSECARRIRSYYQPYHLQIRTTLDALKDEFGYAVIFDAHSIRSEVPRLFDGRLPDLNVGTHDGQSCSATLASRLVELCSGAQPFTFVANGRFKGGYITRHYGCPEQNIHAVQLEIAQSAYMDEGAEPRFDARTAAPLQEFLMRWIETIIQWHPDH